MMTSKILTMRPAYSTFFRNEFTERTKLTVDSQKRKMSTVDNAEVEHHEKYKNIWWDKDKGMLRGLHSMNPLRVQFIRDGLANTGFKETNPCRPLEGVKILDVGCGAGILSESLARAGADTTGIDPAAELISLAKEHASLDPSISGKINYLNSNIEQEIKSNPESYNAVVASEVLEHVTNKEMFVKYCVKAVKPGGSIFITTINKTLLSWLGGIIIAEHILNFVPRGTHDWDKFISPKETGKMLERCGCETRLVHGLLCNPIKNEWHWSSCTEISYALHAVKDKASRKD